MVFLVRYISFKINSPVIYLVVLFKEEIILFYSVLSWVRNDTLFAQLTARTRFYYSR